LLWLLFGINLMVFYFVNTWTPAVLGEVVAKAGGARESASTALGAFQLAGTLGGLVLTRFLDKYGLRPVLGLIIVALPVTAAMGWFASHNLLVEGAAVAGFCLLAIQFGLNASAGIIYPTEIRSNGVGWAFGIGRFGAVLGPFLGAYLLGRNFTIEQLFVLVAAPLVISAIACFALIRLHDTANPTEAAKGSALSH
jgi:AAHS family 4-hydroxybenzoate transporter-like MFS transporter